MCTPERMSCALAVTACVCAAPKAAREEYELFLQAVAGLLGGDLACEELQEAAVQVCAGKG
jgi:hypothetical protein